VDRGNTLGSLSRIALVRGDLERALRLLEASAFASGVDLGSLLLATETAQRLGRPEEAVRIARRASEVILPVGHEGERVKGLVAALAMIGKPAPGFDGVSWWKGVGGPVSREDLRGRVTVLYSWNMQSAWNRFLFKRVAELDRDYRKRGVRVIGISRLARFDPIRMETREELTDEDELVFLDMWKQQYQVTWPLAVCPYKSDVLEREWAVTVVPQWIVVGKDGNVFAVMSGKDEERIDALRHLVDLALFR
jgi:hypothetical protein